MKDFEIVLADCKVIYANEKQYADLLHALCGGSNNYGVVTRIDSRRTIKVISEAELSTTISIPSLNSYLPLQTWYQPAITTSMRFWYGHLLTLTKEAIVLATLCITQSQ